MNSRIKHATPQGRLTWETEVMPRVWVVNADIPEREETEFAAAFELWIEGGLAIDTLAAAESALVALNGKPLRPRGKNRRRRCSTASMADSSTSKLFGTFPVQHGSVRAEVLARLLQGESLTALDAVFSSSTTRLADQVFNLRQMGWPIETREKTVHTTDGRDAQVAEYRMPSTVIDAAMVAGGAEFCGRVLVARTQRRTMRKPGGGRA